MRHPLKRRLALAALLVPRFQADHGNNNLQTIFDPVAELLQQRRNTLVRSRVLVLESPALGHVFDRQQDLLCLFAGPIDLPRIEQHHPSSNRRKHAVYFKGLDRRMFGKDGFDQGAQLGIIPLSVAELVELQADRFLWGGCECVAKGTVRKLDRQVGIEHKQAFTDRLYEIQWVDFAHGMAGSCAPSDDLARGPHHQPRWFVTSALVRMCCR